MLMERECGHGHERDGDANAAGDPSIGVAAYEALGGHGAERGSTIPPNAVCIPFMSHPHLVHPMHVPWKYVLNLLNGPFRLGIHSNS